VTGFGPALVDGINDGLAPLRFAGEHTAYGFIGYMEGALSSGVRVANDLVKHHTGK
jgi:monoamine oxidase